MQVNKDEFDELVEGIDFEAHPELVKLVLKIKNRHANLNSKVAKYVKEKRKKNPNYAKGGNNVTRTLGV